MLVLARSENEKIYITDKTGRVVAIITAVTCRAGATRIGISAPQCHGIHRDDYVLRDASVGEELILRGRE